MESFQSFIAIPYSKSECAVVSAPIGWVVDGSFQSSSAASFYPAGLSRDEAYAREGYIYLMFSHKDKNWPDLPHLLNVQKLNAMEHYKNPKIEYLDTIKREDCVPLLRVIDAEQMGDTIEYTMFLDFSTVILFMVSLTPRKKENSYLKKLEWVAEKLIKGKIILKGRDKTLKVLA